MIQARQKINALDLSVLGMVVVPADNLILISMRFLRNTIIHNQNPVIGFYLAHISFDQSPQVSRCLALTSQKALNAVMADLTIEQIRQTRSRRQTEGTNEIIRVKIKHFIIVHATSLFDFLDCAA